MVDIETKFWNLIDYKNQGVYLNFGSCWTLGDPVLKDPAPDPPLDSDSGSDVDQQGRLSVAGLSRNLSETLCYERVEVLEPGSWRLSDHEDAGDLQADVDFILHNNHGVLRADVGDVIQENAVYLLPDLPVPGIPSPPDPRVVSRAKKLSLHPDQEHLRMPIARALVTRRVKSPKVKSKGGFIGKIFRKL